MGPQLLHCPSSERITTCYQDTQSVLHEPETHLQGNRHSECTTHSRCQETAHSQLRLHAQRLQTQTNRYVHMYFTCIQRTTPVNSQRDAHRIGTHHFPTLDYIYPRKVKNTCYLCSGIRTLFERCIF